VASRIPEVRAVRGAETVAGAAPPRRGALLIHEGTALVGDFRAMKVPPQCACCGAATDPDRMIPACRSCRAHQRLHLAALVGLGVATPLVGLAVAHPLRGLAPFAGPLGHGVLVLAAAALLPWFALALALLVRPRGRHVTWGNPVDFSGEEAVCLDASFGRAVAALNRAQARDVRRWRFHPGALLVGLVVLPLLPAAWAVHRHGDWHLSLHVDNGTTAAVEVRTAEGRRLVWVPAGEHRRVVLPRTDLELTARSGQEVIDALALRPGTSAGAATLGHESRAESFVWNLDARNCYREIPVTYRSASSRFPVLGVPREVVGERVFATGAREPMSRAPDEIQVPRSKILDHELRSELLRIPCPGAASQW
jgi:hypothetical protein